MSSTSCEVRMQLTATETLAGSEVPAAATDDARTLRFAGFNASGSLTPTSTPALTAPPAAQSIELGGSATTLDLTAMALARDGTKTHDYTGKKVVGAIFKAGASNAAAINIAPGGSNPYPLFGTGNDLDLKPGMCLEFCFLDAATTLPAVSGTVKTIDISGTEDDTLDVLLLLG